MIGGTRSYAVVWRKDDGPVVPGQLALEERVIRLLGGGRNRPVEHALPYDMVQAVRLAHRPDERIHGNPSLLLEAKTLERYLIAAIGGLGVVAELADMIANARPLA